MQVQSVCPVFINHCTAWLSSTKTCYSQHQLWKRLALLCPAKQTCLWASVKISETSSLSSSQPGTSIEASLGKQRVKPCSATQHVKPKG